MKNKTIICIVSVILILIVGVFSYKAFFNKKDSNDNLQSVKINLYSIDMVNKKVFEQPAEIKPFNQNTFNEIIDLIRHNSKYLKTESFIPEKLKVIDFDFDENANLVKINFSNEYNYMKEIEELFFKTAFVWSITELPNIKNVEIFVNNIPIKKDDGQNMGILNRENIILDQTLPAEKVDSKTVNLYFVDEEETQLVKEKRTIKIKQSDTLEKQILEELIAGPRKKGDFPSIPPETKIRNVKTEDGICYVDLSSEFITRHTGGSAAEEFTIYSIINSLTELDYVDKVQFLIEGEKVSEYKSSVDISKPLGRK